MPLPAARRPEGRAHAGRNRYHHRRSRGRRRLSRRHGRLRAGCGTGCRAGPPGRRSTQWPQLTWYTAEEYGQKQNDPARIWRRTTAGTWQVVRSGRLQNGTASGPLAVSPDGRRAAWVEASARRLVISGFDGTKRHVIPTQGQQTCEPSWLDSGRVLYGLGREKQITFIAVNADGTGRKVLATHQAKCPTVSGGWIAQVTDRAVRIRNEHGNTRSISPRIPAGLVIGGVAAISGNGRTLVISAHTTSPGGCGCGWRFRNYRLDASSGAVTELAPVDSAWTQRPGTAKPSTGSSWPTAVWWCRSTRRRRPTARRRTGWSGTPPAAGCWPPGRCPPASRGVVCWAELPVQRHRVRGTGHSRGWPVPPVVCAMTSDT
ncbi:hypothetical protein JNW90_16955 [Micromonospora sp. STR1s_5]|nr:hypothetical protein [Micromonospora sp. STR1s_5]